MDSTFKTLIDAALKAQFDVEGAVYVIEPPKDFSHGDLATNAALVVSKQLGKSPKEIADAVAAYIDSHKGIDIAAVSVAGPGFINIAFNRSYFADMVARAGDAAWGATVQLKGKTILVEHSSPNLFKPFHIGHLMNNAIGESIVRLARASGATVQTMSFPSDISLGVAKAVFILLEKYGTDFAPDNVEALGAAYREGTLRYDDDETVQDRIKEIANNLYAHTPSPEVTLFEKCKAFNIAYFESVLATLGSHFDAYIYESEAGVVGKQIVLDNTPKVFTESEGAIVYVPAEERKDINTAVFINSQGNPTYEAKDLGLIDIKFSRFNPDTSIFITDHEQEPHFRVVLAALAQIDTARVSKNIHRTHGRMTFKGAKMSSRLGGVPVALEVLETVIAEVKEKNPDITDTDAQAIAIAAIKVAILRAAAGKNINFDPDTSLSFEGDSGPYIQYCAVRAQSVLAKAEGIGMTPGISNPTESAHDLERIIAQFPRMVARSIDEWASHYLVTYLLELSQAFNSWYAVTKVIDESNPHAPYNLAIVAAVRNTLTKGLDLLGISVPEKM